MRTRLSRAIFGFAAALALAVAPASAAVSVAAGAWLQDTPSQAGGAVLVSSGASIPSYPLDIQGTLAVPLTGRGGYALTAEIRGFTGGGYGGAYVGAGAGIGNLAIGHAVGPVLTVFAGKSIATSTSIELRLYHSTTDGGSTAGFAGLRFTF